MLRKLLTILTICLVGVSYGFAQSGSIEGTVTDSNTDEPLAASNVYIVELERGTSSNADGEFTIENVPSGTYTLRTSFIGYRTSRQQVQVGNNITTVNIQLNRSSESLDEVVVTGYQNFRREESNISVSSIDSTSINNRPNVSTAQTLTGQVSGLNIQTNSGQPGADSEINIRGVGSLNGDSEPLIILDGTEINQDNIGQINPNTIADVTVLKDAGATAIYGNRGANGVILIKTKQGSYNSGVQVSYSTQLKSTSLRERGYNELNGRQELQLEQNFLGSNFLGFSQAELDDPATQIPNTNWVDVFFDPGLSTVHNLSISNGKENIKNFTSLGYTFQDGALNSSSIQRFNLRNNLTGRSDDRKFNYNVNSAINYEISDSRTNIGTTGINRNPLIAAQESVPYLTPDDYPGNGFDLLALRGFSVPFTHTPLFILDRQQYERNSNSRLKLTGRAAGSYQIVEGLEANLSVGGDYERNDNQQSEDPRSFNALLFAEFGNNTPGFSDTFSTESFTYDLSTNLKYRTQFSDVHQVSVGAYFELNQGFYTFSGFRNNGIFAPTFEPGDGTSFVPDNSSNDFFTNPVSLDQLQSGLLSYFGTLDYSFSDRYGVSFTLRRDASYRFVDDNAWGTFYSASARWNVSNEEFMDYSWLDALKLRASFGKSGNQVIVNEDGQFRPFAGNSLTQDLYGSTATYGGQFATLFTQLGNPNLQWENIYQTNVGIDFDLFNTRLSGAVDAYLKRTTDLFLQLPVSAVTGASINANGSPAIDTNNGSLENRGIEFELSYDILRQRNGFNLTVGALGGYNKQEIKNLPQEDGAIEDGNQITREGGPLGEYFVYPYAGVNEDNGNLLFRDIDGNLTEDPSPSDRRRTGKNLFPEFQGSFTLDMSYKGVFFETQWQYAVGIDRIDGQFASLVDPTSIGQFNHSEEILDAWTPQNTDGSQPSLTADNLSDDGLSDRFIVSSDFLRLRFAQIGYQLPASFLDQLNVRGARVFVSGENIIDFTPWEGLDPQTQSNNSRLYPNPRIFTVGLDLEF